MYTKPCLPPTSTHVNGGSFVYILFTVFFSTMDRAACPGKTLGVGSRRQRDTNLLVRVYTFE